jgi:hypothetical protein
MISHYTEFIFFAYSSVGVDQIDGDLSGSSDTFVCDA